MRPTLIDVHIHTIPAAWSANATPLNPVNLAEKPAEIPCVPSPLNQEGDVGEEGRIGFRGFLWEAGPRGAGCRSFGVASLRVNHDLQILGDGAAFGRSASAVVSDHP